jgi:hypothetical protein
VYLRCSHPRDANTSTRAVSLGTTKARLIPNDGERRHKGEAITTGVVESTVNHVSSQRFVKKLQKKWPLRGAPSLLLKRMRVLSDELWQTFRRWHPGVRGEETE